MADNNATAQAMLSSLCIFQAGGQDGSGAGMGPEGVRTVAAHRLCGVHAGYEAATGAADKSVKLDDMEALLAKLAALSLADKDLEVQPPPEEAAELLPRQELQTRFVVTLGRFAGSLHACASPTADTPVELRRTRCGRTFGANKLPHKFVERVRAQSWAGPICDRCFPLGVPQENTSA